MTVTTFELDPVTVALQAWLEEATEVAGEDSIAPEEPPPFYWVLFQLGSTRPDVTPLAAQSVVRVTYQVTSVGVTPSQARTIADRVRIALVGTDPTGVETAELDLDGVPVTVILRESNDDGALDVVNRIPQWSETFALTLAPTELPGP